MSLEDIKARADKATPAPWWVGQYTGPADIFSGNGSGSDPQVAGEMWKKDAEFIAHARTDIPKLVAALEAIEEHMVSLDIIQSVNPERKNASAAGISKHIRAAIAEALA